MTIKRPEVAQSYLDQAVRIDPTETLVGDLGQWISCWNFMVVVLVWIVLLLVVYMHVLLSDVVAFLMFKNLNLLIR